MAFIVLLASTGKIKLQLLIWDTLAATLFFDLVCYVDVQMFRIDSNELSSALEDGSRFCYL